MTIPFGGWHPIWQKSGRVVGTATQCDKMMDGLEGMSRQTAPGNARHSEEGEGWQRASW